MGYFTERRFERRFKPATEAPVRITKSRPECRRVPIENPKRNKKQREGGMRNGRTGSIRKMRYVDKWF